MAQSFFIAAMLSGCKIILTVFCNHHDLWSSVVNKSTYYFSSLRLNVWKGSYSKEEQGTTQPGFIGGDVHGIVLHR